MARSRSPRSGAAFPAILADPWTRVAVGGTAALLVLMVAAKAAGSAATPLYQASLSGVGLFALLVAIARGVRSGSDRRAHLLSRPGSS